MAKLAKIQATINIRWEPVKSIEEENENNR